jgi:hypothetical protein
LLASLAASCKANNGIGAEDAGASGNDAASFCRGKQIPQSACPLTWSMATASLLPECLYGPASARLGRRGSYLDRQVYSAGAASGCGVECLYDVGSGALAGAHRCSGFADFCDETSAEIYYGVATPDDSFVEDPTLGTAPACDSCRGDLADSTCPRTWEAASTVPNCDIPPGFLFLGHAAGYLAQAFEGGYTVGTCYYDAGTHALVGAYAASDVATLCNGTSFAIFYGTATPNLPFTPDLGPAPTCTPDGGAVDAGTPDAAGTPETGD